MLNAEENVKLPLSVAGTDVDDGVVHGAVTKVGFRSA